MFFGRKTRPTQLSSECGSCHRNRRIGGFFLSFKIVVVFHILKWVFRSIRIVNSRPLEKNIFFRIEFSLKLNFLIYAQEFRFSRFVFRSNFKS